MLKDNTVQLVYDRFIYPSYLLQHGKGGKKYIKKNPRKQRSSKPGMIKKKSYLHFLKFYVLVVIDVV